MLAIFCLRLACGLIGSLFVISPRQVNPRFYRVQFLTALGLVAVTAVTVRETASPWLWGWVLAGLILAFLGSLAWSLENSPGGTIAIVVAFVGLAVALATATVAPVSESPPATAKIIVQYANEFSSAALLGMATSAMLMGHSYLIAPAMSLTPLLNLLMGLFGALTFRMIVAGFGLWSWTAALHPDTLDDEIVIWLPVRWGVGLVGPLVLGGMAWNTAKIRSTQSATGILYVVVIFCYLGELTSQVLRGTTGICL